MKWTELEFFSSPKFQKILTNLHEQRKADKVVLPPRDDIFNSLILTSFDETKVVILGQDPYPTVGHANGLAFSVNPGVKPLPKSLVNIFKELQSDTGTKRTNGDLSDWAQQGVLLLNTSLTVLEGKPASHSDIGWGMLTNEMIRCLSEQKENLVFILWGKHAQQKGMVIDQNKHHVIKSVHPSPLSAHSGFFGSKPFSKTNKYLTDKNLTPITW